MRGEVVGSARIEAEVDSGDGSNGFCDASLGVGQAEAAWLGGFGYETAGFTDLQEAFLDVLLVTEDVVGVFVYGLWWLFSFSGNDSYSLDSVSSIDDLTGC